MSSVLTYFHPEVRAGGFPVSHQRTLFFLRVQSLLPEGARVLDFGAGRGKWGDREQGTFTARFSDLRGQAKELVGFDVDDAVEQNPYVDRTAWAGIGQRLPFPDQHFDLIYSWAVLEHIADPEFYAHEIDRILKPGGWFCAWTPNKWGYVGMAARMVPNDWHVGWLRTFQPERSEVDTFPTAYKLNTIGDVGRHFDGYENASYIWTGPPVYHGNKLWLAALIRAYNKLAPYSMGQSLHVFVRKPEA